MEEKANKKEKLIEDKFLKGSTMDKSPLLNNEGNKREGAAVFLVYNPKTDTYETKSFMKKKKKSNKEY